MDGDNKLDIVGGLFDQVQIWHGRPDIATTPYSERSLSVLLSTCM